MWTLISVILIITTASGLATLYAKYKGTFWALAVAFVMAGTASADWTTGDITELKDNADRQTALQATTLGLVAAYVLLSRVHFR